jgi:hypothetical protein
MTLSLYEQLYDCIVNIFTGNAQGTGFFVAPGWVLTCAHVIVGEQGDSKSIHVTWKGKVYPAHVLDTRDVNFPDIALLKVAISNHPCVLLAGSAEPFSKLYSYGFPDIEAQGASTTFECEGWVGEKNKQLRLKEGQVRPGMSGSPVMNLKTGSVCGIVDSTRDRSSDLGGVAILAQVVYREFSALEQKQKQFHAQNTRWLDALTPEQRQQLNLGWQPTPTIIGSAEVLFLYADEADEDKKWVGKLEKHLALMQKQHLITTWHTGKVSEITAGVETTGDFSEHFKTANIILLMVSSDFMDYYRLSDDVEKALEKRKQGARVIPIILRACDWRTSSFGGLRPLPYNGKPIKQWTDDDEAFLEVTQGLRRVVEELKKPPRS